MIDFEKELNAEQLGVVKNGDGPCLVLAGAGSGKTRTITYRVAYVLSKGIDPNNILLVTFTNKAAKEMTSRVQALVGKEARLPWSGTFHHIGYRLMKQYAPLLGYRNDFTILDSQDSRDLIKLCLKQEGIDRKEKRFPSAKVVQSIISYARNAETTIEDVLDLKHPKWLDLADVIVRIMAEYDKRKREANAMDFDDLLVNTHLLLLKSPRVKEKFSQQFQYVLVDEYQDTNRVQASIVKLFASHHKNLLVVGDDAQSIYSFRAANIANILYFEQHYPDAKVFRLQTNYRSTPNILDVANEVISNNQDQYQKELKSVVKAATTPEVHAFTDQQEEAQFIANQILELRDEGVPLQHMAVLFRAAFHSQALEVELTKRDIPYDFRGGVRFFERAHIKDVLAYLRIFHNPTDTIAWSRVLNMQVGIGPAGAQKIINTIQNSVIASERSERGNPEIAASPSRLLAMTGEELQHVGSVLSARGQMGWNDFLQIYSSFAEASTDKEASTPTELIEAVIGSKYQDYLENEYPDYRDRLQDLQQLALFAERQPDLHQFLADASLQESYTAAQTRSAADDDEQLILSTIHQAKGLEWEVVFIMHAAAGQFPSDRAAKEPKGIEEERRLFYVAVTRAKRLLYLSYPLTAGYSAMLGGPSMFIEEVGSVLLDHHALGGSTVFTDPSDGSGDVTYVPFDDDRPRTSFLKDISEL